jgi:predicted O-linked N-acetylglucosamine transferase (SPINDLY family)
MPDSPGAMAAQAVVFASDAHALATLRAGLRAQLLASPLLDGPGLARALESAYRALWVSTLS